MKTIAITLEVGPIYNSKDLRESYGIIDQMNTGDREDLSAWRFPTQYEMRLIAAEGNHLRFGTYWTSSNISTINRWRTIVHIGKDKKFDRTDLGYDDGSYHDLLLVRFIKL